MASTLDDYRRRKEMPAGQGDADMLSGLEFLQEAAEVLR
jgi:hypothetical protein